MKGPPLVATPAPTWDPSKFAAKHSLNSRRAAVHALAVQLAAHPGSATFRVIPLPEQSLAVLLLAELAESANAAHDSTTVCCVLSCVANLRLVGLPSADIESVCRLVMRHASAEPEARAFACAAAYNLSQEPWVLETLSRVHADAGEPLEVRMDDPTEVAQHGGTRGASSSRAGRAGRAGRLRLEAEAEAPPCLHAAALCAPEQSLGRLPPAVHKPCKPWSPCDSVTLCQPGAARRRWFRAVRRPGGEACACGPGADPRAAVGLAQARGLRSVARVCAAALAAAVRRAELGGASPCQGGDCGDCGDCGDVHVRPDDLSADGRRSGPPTNGGAVSPQQPQPRPSRPRDAAAAQLVGSRSAARQTHLGQTRPPWADPVGHRVALCTRVFALRTLRR